MAEQDNLRLTREADAAFRRGDLPAVLALMADDIEWTAPGPDDVPSNETWRGTSAVLEYLDTLNREVEFHAFEPREFLAGGIRWWSWSTTTSRSGAPAAGSPARGHVCTSRDGRLARFRLFEDISAVAAAWFPDCGGAAIAMMPPLDDGQRRLRVRPGRCPAVAGGCGRQRRTCRGPAAER
jgi:ketosteroid isomerase-like protein